MSHASRLLLPAALLLLPLVHCSRGADAPPAPATAIGYENPSNVPAGAFYLKQNTALSTPGTHLVLDLYGPATGTGSGVVLCFTLDTTKATWSATPLLNGTVFTANSQGAPIAKAKVDGGTLQIVVTERGASAPKALNGPLLSLALDMKTGHNAGTAVTLTPDLAKSQLLSTTVGPFPDLKVGTLTLK